MHTKRALLFFTCSVPLVWASYPFTASRFSGPTTQVGVALTKPAEARSKGAAVISHSPLPNSSTNRHELGRHEHPAGFSLPLVVDGSKTPDAIPDSLAYRHFLMITAEPAAAEVRLVSRRTALLSRLGLTPSDRAAYISALDGVREQLNSLEQQISMASTVAIVDALKTRRDQTLDNARLRVQSNLSTDGAKLLDRHIREYVKRGIVIYGEPR